MRGIVESWDPSHGRGWIRPVAEADRPLRVSPNARIEVERRVLSPSLSGGLKTGQQVGFVYRAPARPDLAPRAECVVVIAEPIAAPAVPVASRAASISATKV
jgi:hypothetical protein